MNTGVGCHFLFHNTDMEHYKWAGSGDTWELGEGDSWGAVGTPGGGVGTPGGEENPGGQWGLLGEWRHLGRELGLLGEWRLLGESGDSVGGNGDSWGSRDSWGEVGAPGGGGVVTPEGESGILGVEWGLLEGRVGTPGGRSGDSWVWSGDS